MTTQQELKNTESNKDFGSHAQDIAQSDDMAMLLQEQKEYGFDLSKDGLMHKQTYCSACETIWSYLASDLCKKSRSFCIGIFTVMMVVSFITMLKSVIDVSSVAFLKIGQDQAGAFDLQLTSDYG